MIGARARKLAGRQWPQAAMAAAAIFWAWWLWGAELAPVAPSAGGSLPALAPAPALELVSPVSDPFRRRIESATAAIPANVWDALWRAGWRVQMAEFVVDAAPSLVGAQPRGWPSGLTWEHTDAVNLPQRRVVVVAEKRRNRLGEVVPADRIEGVFRHELGHAYDRAAGGPWKYRSSHPEFVVAYTRDAGAIAPARRAEMDYYLQGDEAGRQEAYAEAFAVVLGGGSDPAKRDAFLQTFPRVIAHVRQTLTESPAVTQTAGK